MGMLSLLGNDISCAFRGTFSGNKYEECIIIQQHLLPILRLFFYAKLGIAVH